MKQKKTTPVKQLSGGARLKASGHRPVLLGIRPDLHDRLRAAANIDGLPLTQFILQSALRTADKKLAVFLADSSKSA